MLRIDLSLTRAVCAAVAAVALTAAPASALPRDARVETYARGLHRPVDMAWVPGTNKVFFTELDTGKVRVLDGRRLLRRPCVDLRVDATNDRGALGIAVSPDFDENRHLYVYFTKKEPLENRVVRFTVRRNRCEDATPVVTGLGVGNFHQGGQLAFSGGKLFVAVGDNQDAALAQDLSSRQGKVLRLNPDGGVPADNPVLSDGAPGAVWSYGHRNPFGLAGRAGTDDVFLTENGPGCDDEVNLLAAGRNFGHGPDSPCPSPRPPSGDDPVAPLFLWPEVVAPTDAWWYQGRMDALSGDLYAGDYLYGRIHRFDVAGTGADARVRAHRIVHDSDHVFSVSKGPGGWLYFVSSGRIQRIVPR